jgi:L-ascorbate peroxidase
VDWLKFDNSYFKDVKAAKDSELVVLETDAALFEDEGFRQVLTEKHADSPEGQTVV